MVKKVIIGIDPGLYGAVALLDEDGDILGVHPMPIHLGGTGKDEIDSAELDFLLGVSPILVVIEKVGPVRGAAAQSTFTFGRVFEALITTCKINDYRYELVTPQDWKKGILNGTKKDKEAALAWCARRFPKEDLQGDDGKADALCLAEYGRRFLLGKPLDSSSNPL